MKSDSYTFQCLGLYLYFKIFIYCLQIDIIFYEQCSNKKTKECAADNYIQKHSVKKCLSKQSKDTLVDIGSMFDRWQQLKKKLCIRKDKDLAGFLLCQ